MGEDRIKRRRFLADLLFAGGALTAAALAARAYSANPTSEPQVAGTPAFTEPVPADTSSPLPCTASPNPRGSRVGGDFVVQPKTRAKPGGTDDLK